ncbi:hypothetical protein PTRA_b0373 [Pseudoalteromonas translucida KMM 520]|uniref:Uncharacterized protein n=1 Tax=Pseudoalteromonas translucida KMM 520 TaxID=1315283 RepID=A0A0U2XC77_9GAMM|nr:hypothetical protein PTRA_b0373 [Pseudoalteromonas translucida KMM 520]
MGKAIIKVTTPTFITRVGVYFNQWIGDKSALQTLFRR